MEGNLSSRLLTVFLLGVLPLAAQTSSLQGVITDGQSAGIPEAVVTATNLSTSAARKAVSGATGSYSLLQVQPGPYKITVEKPGFRTSITEVRLQIDTPATLDVKLELGQVTETINVEAEAATINTQNASVGNPFTELQIKGLPLQSRNVVALLSLQPGVAPGGQVLGAKPDQNNVTLDGIDVNDQEGNSGLTPCCRCRWIACRNFAPR